VNIQKAADAIAVASLPANAALWWGWVEKIDLLIRVGAGVGSFILIWWAVWVKVRQWRAK
jgi:hypothetical protein